MYLYEKCIIDDINSLFTNSKVKAIIADSLDEGLRRSAAENEDKVTLPFIVLSGGDWILNDTNFYNYMHGSESHRTDNVAKVASVISFTPNYTIYIAASSSRECDMLTREIIFHYYQNPTLTVKVPYGLDTLHTFNLHFGTNVRKVQRTSGLVYRTLDFDIDGAYLWHNNSMNVVKSIEVDVEEKMERYI